MSDFPPPSPPESAAPDPASDDVGVATAPAVTLDDVHGWVERGDAAAVVAWFEAADNADATRLLSQLPGDDRERLLALVDPETARWVVEYLPAAQAVSAIGELEPRTAARILEELPSDEQADFLGELETEQAEAILAEYDEREDAAEVRQLAAYDDDEAGGIMATEFLAFDREVTVGQVLEDVAANAERYPGYEVRYAYVTGDDGVQVGVPPVRDMLLAGRRRALRETMKTEPIRLSDHMPLAEARGVFREHPFLGLPAGPLATCEHPQPPCRCGAAA